ncbi:MAG: RNA-binding domain-containing protein [Candidatus Thermoplasmatota archaeon]|nr:RNA-binding domain-containing protein [Candidatus Thermoplasmatota archaeon]
MNIEIIVPVKNTEDSSKVKQALFNIFPDAVIEEKEGMLIGKAKSFENFKKLLEMQRIRDTVKVFLGKRVRNGTLSFKLNKEAAYAGKINFVIVSHPMGEIKVTIKEKNEEALEEFIDWLTEKE